MRNVPPEHADNLNDAARDWRLIDGPDAAHNSARHGPTRRHHHRALPQQHTVRSWTHCVAPGDGHDEIAHGGLTYRDACSCGASRASEANGGRIVRGPWVVQFTAQQPDGRRP